MIILSVVVYGCETWCISDEHWLTGGFRYTFDNTSYLITQQAKGKNVLSLFA
jgi:hypothetical protein